LFVATIKSFEELDCWKAGKEFYVRVRALVNESKIQREFYLRDQLLRAALSVSNNIAEGFERSGEKEFKRYLIISNGSAAECKSMLLIISEVFHEIDDSQIKELYTLADKVINLNKGLIKYLNTRIK